jgi:type III pantothenate kinase
MILALDIGNTNIKSALFDNDSTIDFTIHSDLNLLYRYISNIHYNQIIVSSVNKSLERKIIDQLKFDKISLFQVDIMHKFNFIIAYETPETLGMDRVCSASGAQSIALKNKILSENQYLITIDFGTATTINIISPDKKFIGGSIAPGITTMLKSLKEDTAQLPLAELDWYKGIIGRSTNSSILSGVVTATIGLIKETYVYLEKQSGISPIVFATGGNARYMIPYLDFKIIFDEALVLKGLKTIYDLNNPLI